MLHPLSSRTVSFVSNVMPNLSLNNPFILLMSLCVAGSQYQNSLPLSLSDYAGETIDQTDNQLESAI
jgi:hypothetical protein